MFVNISEKIFLIEYTAIKGILGREGYIKVVEGMIEQNWCDGSLECGN